MSVRIFHKAITYLREVQEMALFATMADSRWYVAFGVSPLFFMMLPFLGLLLTINALINVYYFVNASNKNITQWLNLVVSSLCAVLATISLYGAVLSAFWGVSFAAGPWFFFSSLMLAMTHQATILGLNLYRTYESLPSSEQRMHYLQAAYNNLFTLGWLSGALAAVMFVMLFPTAAPGLGVAGAITAITFTLVDVFWHIIPKNWKFAVKELLNLAKPELPKEEAVAPREDINSKVDKIIGQNPNHHRLFTRFDFSLEVRKMDVETARRYLEELLRLKIASVQSYNGVKASDKFFLLSELSNVVTSDSKKINKNALLKQYPLAFQSFFVETGEVEQLCNAVLVFQEKRQNSHQADLSIINSLN